MHGAIIEYSKLMFLAERIITEKQINLVINTGLLRTSLEYLLLCDV
jgi:hypothetical protein